MANNQRFSTSVGTAVYPRLGTPDTKYYDLGIYKADLAVPLEEAEPTMAQLKEIHKEHVGKPPKAADNSMWYFETDEEGEETGNVIFKFRVKNRTRKDGELWDRKPVQFDAQLNKIDVNPWGGSKMAVSYEVYAWKNPDGKKGISLQPMGVQIIELVAGDGPSASSMGFGAQEGYTGEASESGFSKGQTDDDGSDDAGDGDY